MTKRAVTYARVSGDDRDTDGRNLKSQAEMCRDHCRKHGYTIVEALAEDIKGASGADFDLPQLTRLLEMAQAGEFDVLVVREVDRLSRDQIKAAIIRRDLKKCGVTIEYVLYDFAPGPAGDMARQMMEVIAEYQRQDTILKMGRGRRNSVKSGNVNVSGRPPYGYHVVEDRQGDKLLRRRLELYEPEARIVRMIFDWYTAGEDGQRLTVNGITRRLRELGIPTPCEHNRLKGQNKTAGACDWARDVVVRMLKNETYTGRWYYGKRRSVKEAEIGLLDPRLLEALKASLAEREQAGANRHKPGCKYTIWNLPEHWLELAVPALVEQDVWTAAQAQLKENRRNAWRPTAEEYLLRRRLNCEKCGRAMQCEYSQTSRGANHYRYYKCKARRQKLSYAHPCDQPTFRADWVDAAVWQWVKGLLSEPGKLQAAIDELEHEGEKLAAPARRRLAALDELMAENKADTEQVREMGRRRIYTLDRAEAEIARLGTDLAALSKRHAKEQAAVAGQLRSSDQVRAVLEFAKEQGPNVEKGAQRFDVRRGLMEDLDVTAALAIGPDGVPEVHASCVLGEQTLRQVSHTTG